MTAIEKAGGYDRRILELAAAGLSPEDISLQLGGTLSAPKVAIRVQKLIESPDDYLTVVQQMRLNLKMLRQTLADLQSKYLDNDQAKIRLTYMKEITATLERLQKSNDQDVNSYNAAVGRAMGRIYDLALAHIGGAIRERIDPEEWAELKREALGIAQAEVAKQQIEA